ncbi:MAG TPA: hypothetical protein VFY10_08295 [Dehalococcoidia bacterium]|nr:hypothetical protein [Dehalococcoidia bacterium]
MSESPDGEAPCNEFLDGVVQSLFGAGLRLENCLHMLEDNSANLKTELDTLIDKLHETIGTIRLHVHGPALFDAASGSNPVEGEVDGI